MAARHRQRFPCFPFIYLIEILTGANSTLNLSMLPDCEGGIVSSLCSWLFPVAVSRHQPCMSTSSISKLLVNNSSPDAAHTTAHLRAWADSLHSESPDVSPAILDANIVINVQFRAAPQWSAAPRSSVSWGSGTQAPRKEYNRRLAREVAPGMNTHVGHRHCVHMQGLQADRTIHVDHGYPACILMVLQRPADSLICLGYSPCSL